MSSKTVKRMLATRRLSGEAFREGGLAFHPPGPINLGKHYQYLRSKQANRDAGKVKK